MSIPYAKKRVISTFILLFLSSTYFFGIFVSWTLIEDNVVSAATIIVDGSGGGDHKTISAAIAAATSGDIIEVRAGTYNESITIDKTLTLIGAGASNTTINAGGTGDVVLITASRVNLSNFKVKGAGTNSWDSGIRLEYADHCRLVDINASGNRLSIRLNYADNNYLENISADKGYYAGFSLSYSNNNTIINASSVSHQFGITQYYSNNNSYRDINCSDNTWHGIYLQYSADNTIKNCNVSDNQMKGIYLTESSGTIIIDNYLYNNTEEPVSISKSASCTVLNNTIVSGGICIFGSSVDYWTSHTIATNNTVHGKPVYYFKNSNDITIPADAGALILANCTNTKIENMNFTGTSFGIQLGYSDGITIRNNEFYANRRGGIYFYYSNRTTIDDNIFSSNELHGIYFYYSDHFKIENNIGKYNYAGIFGSGTQYSEIMNNTFDSNTNTGIIFYWEVYYSKIINNSLQDNYNGINADLVFNNEFSNNTGDLNGRNGFIIDRSDYNIFSNNSCSNNTYDGFYINHCDENVFTNNTIAYNSRYGLNVMSGTNNVIYHNNILFNTQQATAAAGHTWNNEGLEGNYWSDYTGADDGSGFWKHAIAGDGIGDTNLPHLGLDDYPFIRESGWIYPSKPNMTELALLDTDGIYTLEWSAVLRASGYILEESTSPGFQSFSEIYTGPDTQYQIKNKPNGTYYYRVKAYTDSGEGYYSNAVHTIVDFVPQAPTNLRVTNIKTNVLTLIWDPLKEPDIQGIEIYINDTNKGLEGPYRILKAVNDPVSQYNVTDLNDKMTYYFMIRVFDHHHYSVYSAAASGTTLDGTPPASPSGLNATPVHNYRIDLKWEQNKEDDLAGYHIFMNDTMAGAEINYKMIITLSATATTYTLTGLAEETTYYFKMLAFDEAMLNSSFSNIVSATTPDIIPPDPPAALTVTAVTMTTITLTWNANTEHDFIGYNIYRSFFAQGSFDRVNDKIVKITEYTDTDLEKDTIYYYKVKAVDNTNLESEFSEAVWAKTKWTTDRPELIEPFTDFSIPEDSYIDDRIDLHKHFWDHPDRTPLYFECEGQVNIEVKIYQENGTVTLKPKQNWNGAETLTFHAYNTYSVETNDSITITVTPINDPPENIAIHTPSSGLVIAESETLDLNCSYSDPDLGSGDVLTLKWHSNISGDLGEGPELKSIHLDPGVHLITLTVTDSKGLTAETSIVITVIEDEPPSDITTPDDTWIGVSKGLLIGISVTVISIVMVLVILIIVMRKRRKDVSKVSREEKKDEFGATAPVPPQPQIPMQPPAQPPGLLEPQIPGQPPLQLQRTREEQLPPATGTMTVLEPEPGTIPAPAEQMPEVSTPEQMPTKQIESYCETCNSTLTFVPEYNNWYCSYCSRYEDADEATGSSQDDRSTENGSQEV